MVVQTKEGDNAALMSAVALLRDLPEYRLVRGQVGAIVEPLDETTALVEFSDDDGRPMPSLLARATPCSFYAPPL
jgi:hypothetical protein